MADRKFSGISAGQEIGNQRMIEDTKRPLTRLREWLDTPEGLRTSLYLILGTALLTLWLPFSGEVLLILLLIFARSHFRFHKMAWDFPFRVPQVAKLKDGSDPNGGEGKGIIFLGNDQKTGMQVSLSDSDARTHMAIFGTTGSGKPQPLSAKVLTTTGWKRIRQLRVGDLLATPDGAAGRVIGLFHKGILPVFDITLSENRGTQASAEHLWLAQVDGNKTTATTEQLAAWLAAGRAIQLPVGGEPEQVGTWMQKWLPLVSITPAGDKRCACVLIDHPDHLYYTDDHIVTHNTEFLLGLAYNALVFNSGFIYCDGKGDISLYDNAFRLCRLLGREDSLLLVNFLTSGRDFFERQPDRVSNTMNPYNAGSSGMLTELSVSLMDDSGNGSGGDMWKGRAIAFIGALIRVLVYLRDKDEFLLDADRIRSYFELPPLEKLAWDQEDIWKGGIRRETGYFKKRYGEGYEKAVTPLRSFMVTIPGYDRAKIGKQDQKTLEQHGYITMQLARLFGSLADDYGHIVGTPLGEVNPFDVVVNRRVMIVLLPALEKAPDSLKMLGKIIVGSIKQMAAGSLGNRVSGLRREIVDSRPTKAPTPFITILDEYGYYAVLGFSAMPAQARSLGFSVIFAAQDFASLKKASADEADQTWENTNMRALGRSTGGEDAETMKRFKGLAGEVEVAMTEGYEFEAGTLWNQYRRSQRVQLKKISRLNWDDVASQADGEFHLFMGKKNKRAQEGKMQIVRVNAFYTGYKAVKDSREKEALGDGLSMLDINQFGRVGAPLTIEDPRHDPGYQTFRQHLQSGTLAEVLQQTQGAQPIEAAAYQAIAKLNNTQPNTQP
ncbi:MAG: TraM recognition domain-containing protein, partial [Betaproteobacteria bacterium]|nr:TraM recognition domain-containing protein [Betaproteobacteria bacterium]